MKSFGTATAAALLLWYAAAGTAGEPIPAPHDFAAIAAPVAGPATAPNGFAADAATGAAMAPAGGFPAAPGCAACGGCGCGHHNDFWAWLCYHPLHLTGCGECSGCCGGRWVPLYLYFLGNCQEHPCTACGAAGGGCGCWSGHAWSGAPTGVGFVSH